MSETVSKEVIGRLRQAVIGFRDSKISKEISDPQATVLERFQPVFSVENVSEITEEEFRSFLLLENNRHWSGLHRQGPRMCSDIDKLREGLSILLDESEPIVDRLDKAIDMIPGMGKNVASAILLISHPERYGVWNNRSEANMKALGIWPTFERGESFGSRYVKVNEILLQLQDALKIDLWTLDALWYYLDQTNLDRTSEGNVNGDIVTDDVIEKEQRFGLERHLHEFLRDNWDQIEIGKEWELYSEPGDEEAGYEYPCDIGRIDLLAKNRNKPCWLVVELKRNQTSDQTVGQVLRYMGWVKQNLAEEGEDVRGMIICRTAEPALHYALSTLSSVDLRLYEVEFKLKLPLPLPKKKSSAPSGDT